MAESKTQPGNELRTIATFNTPEEAEVARLALDEPREAPTDPADKKAWRALAAAMVGLFALPPLLHVYSASVLVRLLCGGEPLSRRGKFQCLAAAVIDCAVGGLIVLLVCLSSTAWHPSGRGAQAVPASARRVDLGSLDGPGLATLTARKKGQVVLVDFWATWCAPCVALLPHTVELYDRFQPRGLAVITVSLDEPEERPAVLKFLVDRRAATENYLAPYGASSAAVAAFGIDGGTLPHVRIYDRQGRLVRSFSGDIHADEVRRAVEDLLGRD
jgi:thiol-disulfide isomerase/thioredoxin